jgi:cobyrinic acid a,c-diamide synthase
MVGAIPLQMVLEEKPQGHGYTVLEVTKQNPFYAVGEIFKGHEFHYTRAIIKESEDVELVFKVHRGYGIDGEKDGVCKGNLLATYSHMHARGTPRWGQGLFRAALRSKNHGNPSYVTNSHKGIENGKNVRYEIGANP